MEPNKLEKDFKKKLEQRTIQPSDMAWDRLDAMLSVTEKKKNRHGRAWMYIAAGFLVFLFAGVLFMNQENENNDNTIKNNDAVVTTEQPTQESKTSQDAQTITTPVTEEAVAVETSSTATASQRAVNKTTGKKSRNTVKANESNSIAPIVNNEAVASADKKEGTTILPAAEAENLVAMASAQQGTAKKKAGVKVDPNSLLSSVEGELTESYRSKTFQSVVKGFNTVKVAVANRNYE